MKLIQEITEGIRVSVKAEFMEKESDSVMMEYCFNYLISIENLSNTPIRVIKHFWQVMDSDGLYFELEGDGINGLTPALQIGESFKYNAIADFRTEMGQMSGVYWVENMINHQVFKVVIPTFNFIAPLKMN